MKLILKVYFSDPCDQEKSNKSLIYCIAFQISRAETKYDKVDLFVRFKFFF